jgi:hypothetical protein
VTPRPNNPDEQSVHLHYMPVTLVSRAKVHAASLGITLKDWIIGLMERALGTDHAPKIDRSDTVVTKAPEQPAGRRDLL